MTTEERTTVSHPTNETHGPAADDGVDHASVETQKTSVDAENTDDLWLQLAHECREKCDGETAKASHLMAKIVRGNEQYRKALTDPLIDTACFQWVSRACRNDRESVWTAPNYTKGGNGGRLKRTAEQRSLLMFPLLHGKRLGEATKDEVIETRDWYRKISANMAWKARWLDLIQKNMKKKDATVADCFSNDYLHTLREKVDAE